jgi:hypothetical protein
VIEGHAVADEVWPRRLEILKHHDDYRILAIARWSRWWVSGSAQKSRLAWAIKRSRSNMRPAQISFD